MALLFVALDPMFTFSSKFSSFALVAQPRATSANLESEMSCKIELWLVKSWARLSRK